MSRHHHLCSKGPMLHTPPPSLCYANDAKKLCGIKGADVKGGMGPFSLWVLTSANM
jgi:hypothetical protein